MEVSRLSRSATGGAVIRDVASRRLLTRILTSRKESAWVLVAAVRWDRRMSIDWIMLENLWKGGWAVCWWAEG